MESKNNRINLYALTWEISKAKKPLCRLANKNNYLPVQSQEQVGEKYKIEIKWIMKKLNPTLFKQITKTVTFQILSHLD